MVLYDGAKVPERVRLSDIHRRGWRSPGGSPLGVFVAWRFTGAAVSAAPLFAPVYLPQRRNIFLLFRIFPIDFILTLVYNKSIKKGGDKAFKDADDEISKTRGEAEEKLNPKKKKKKPTKSRVDVRTIVITAIVDFLVGLALLIIDKLT